MVDAPNWHAFYDAVEGRPPHDTLLKTLALFDGKPARARFAIDLGCGGGRDTRELLRRGWRVLAVDREAEGIERLIASVTVEHQPRLLTQVSAFEALTSLPNCDFVNASFSLPFCPPAHFAALWKMLVAALQSGGRFAGTLFGERDGWINQPGMTFHTRWQVEAMLEGFTIEQFNEEESDGKTALGDTKHWHTFAVVAVKR